MKIIFISHDGTLTGAPILLLNLYRLLKKIDNVNEYVFKFKNWPILLETGKNESPITKRLGFKFINGLINKFSFLKKIIKIKEFNGADIIILNTLTNGDIVNLIPTSNIRIITYVHELEIASNYFTKKDYILKQFSLTNEFWVPSKAVESFLMNHWGINKEIIRYMPYYVPPTNENHSKDISNTKKITVGGCGTIDWRKSPDIFILICKKIFDIIPNADIDFIWKGGNKSSIEYIRLNYELNKMNIRQKVIFEDSDSNINDFYRSIDIFLLTSKEDPFPMVVLEAASFGIPTVAFKSSGGAEEFITLSGGGEVVEFLNIDKMSNAIITYYQNKELITKHGKLAKKYVNEVHQNDVKVSSIFFELITKSSNLN